MALVFPSNPNTGDVFADWEWDGSKWTRQSISPLSPPGPPGPPDFVISSTEPIDPAISTLWHELGQRLWQWDGTEWWATTPVQTLLAIGSWTRHPTPAEINSPSWGTMAYGDGLFVAIANNGTIARSPDGINWSFVTSVTNRSWQSVTYGNGLWVAVGIGATGADTTRCITSPDAITWTERTTPSAYWRNVAFGDNLFVATAHSQGTDTQRIMTSSNGINWTLRTTPVAGAWRGVAYGDGTWVVAADTSPVTNKIITSPNGITWTQRTTPTINLWGVAYGGNGHFVAVGGGSNNQFITSLDDGVTWAQYGAPTGSASSWSSIDYGNGLFVAGSSNGGETSTLTSTDGLTWINRTSPMPLAGIGCLAYGDGKFVAFVGGASTTNSAMTMPWPV